MEDFHLDFLCVGFNKCGTSSLHSAMKDIPGIQLPLKKKETCFFAWYDNTPDPMDKFQQRYFPERDDSVIVSGSIEPSFIKKADRVCSYFGKDIKLIFMLRNPMPATWSMFKMRLRRIRGSRYQKLYQVDNGNIHSMFQKYIKMFIVSKEEPDFFYDEWIHQYLQYFPREQMKFVLFEDFLSNYEEQMRDICDFINVPVRELPKLRQINQGNKISRNERCAYYNYKIYRAGLKLRGLGTNYEAFWNNIIAPIFLNFTLKDCPDKLCAENREYLEEIYLDSVRRTSDMIGIDLVEKWYGEKPAAS